MKVTTLYFSATYTTRKVVETVAANLSDEVTTYDITNDAPTESVTIPSDEVLVVGVPVYAGRVPAMAVERLRRFKGEKTPAVVVAVYGNRHYDDAVLELHDIMSECGFCTVAAGAFIAQHSIFPKVGKARPDAKDLADIKRFAEQITTLLDGSFGAIEIPGNRPYKVPGGIPIWPTASRKCTACGACARLCPTGAIDPASPKGVNKEKCIKCGRCIVVCPTKSRRFYGIKYSLAAARFNSAFTARRENEMWFANKE
ncbi:MAG: 4Fe-4S dicluster domain-containing protein [Rikenellaceae bacterium]|nr:4Fe-4S dicluster domain-containing protein [Rikenellaceae bacterium]